MLDLADAGMQRSLVVVGKDQNDHWTRSHGDNGSTKYSALDQIDRSNVAELEVAWIFDSLQHPDGQSGAWQYTSVMRADETADQRALSYAPIQPRHDSLDVRMRNVFTVSPPLVLTK